MKKWSNHVNNDLIRICEYCGKEYLNIYRTSLGYEYTLPTRFCSKSCAAISSETGCIKPLPNKEELKEKSISFIMAQGRYCTGFELHQGTSTSSKTFTKLGLKTSDLNREAGFTKPFSVFQKSVGNILKKYFELVIEEYAIDQLRGKSGYPLRVDFYIPSISTMVEADGIYHNDMDHYWNKINRDLGYDNVELRDKMKDEFCKSNNIRLIRIPYSRVVKESTIMQYFD